MPQGTRQHKYESTSSFESQTWCLRSKNCPLSIPMAHLPSFCPFTTVTNVCNLQPLFNALLIKETSGDAPSSGTIGLYPPWQQCQKTPTSNDFSLLLTVTVSPKVLLPSLLCCHSDSNMEEINGPILFLTTSANDNCCIILVSMYVIREPVGGK